MGKEPPILVVEDDPKTVEIIQRFLERDGFATVTTSSGSQGLELCFKHSPVLVILDLDLPGGLSGMDVGRRIRERSMVPILILTGMADEVDRINGLEMGADDYVTKPFSPKELVARVRAILRRSSLRDEWRPRFSAHGVEVDLERHRVTADGAEIRLTAFEFKLLVALLECPGRVLGREQLLAKIYTHEESYAIDRTIDVHIGKLRHKLERDPARPERILTIRGIGYKFREVGPDQ